MPKNAGSRLSIFYTFNLELELEKWGFFYPTVVNNISQNPHISFKNAPKM